MTPLDPLPGKRRYDALIGTGGIGTGMFFALNGNHTFGREESRTGRFLENRDYAKLHIITHYVQTLMGPGFKSVLVGRVGNDDAGKRLMAEMTATGLNLDHVRMLDDAQTMNCICLVYPDGSGGNLTVGDSACTKVDPAAVQEAETDFIAFEGRGIALAAPEVPLSARIELLELATGYRFLRAASFTSEEIRMARDSDMLSKIDVLFLNRDEAAALTDTSAERPPVEVAQAAVDAVRKVQPAMSLLVTAGKDGSYAWDGQQLTHAAACTVKAASAAGAGDAFCGGTLAGLASGLTLAEAQQLGGLTGALSATSPHTINAEIDRISLAVFAQEQGAELSADVKAVLGMR